MIHDTIDNIATRIEQTETIQPEKKAELLAMVSALKAEVTTLSETHQEQAQSIAGFTQLSTHEATRQQINPELLGLSLKGLASSAAGFEASHPRLVQAVNALCTTLANLGI